MPHIPHLDTYDKWVTRLAKAGFRGPEAEVCAELLACADQDKRNGEKTAPGHLEHLRKYRKELKKAGVNV